MRSKILNGILDIRIIFHRRTHFTNEFRLGNIPHSGKPTLRVSIPQSLDKLRIRLINLEFSARKANTFKDLFDLVEETCVSVLLGDTDVEDWAGEFDVAKVAGTLRHSFTACLTFLGSFDGSE